MAEQVLEVDRIDFLIHPHCNENGSAFVRRDRAAGYAPLDLSPGTGGGEMPGRGRVPAAAVELG